jgi:hypothetical protein
MDKSNTTLLEGDCKIVVNLLLYTELVFQLVNRASVSKGSLFLECDLRV